MSDLWFNESIEKSTNGELKNERSKFKVKIDASTECSESDIIESIETNFIGALEENKDFDEKSKIIVIEKETDEDSENHLYIIEVKNSLEVIEALKTQFNAETYDDLCFSNAVPGEVFIDCISLEEVQNSNCIS